MLPIATILLTLIHRILNNPAFQLPDFRRLAAASASNSIAMSGEQVVFGLLIYRLTESSAWVGISLALYFGSSMVIGMIAGAIADWLDRRRLLRLVECALAANLFLTGLLLALDWLVLWSLLLMIFISGSVRALQHPVRFSYVYDLVGAQHIVSGLGFMNLSTRSGQLLGALIGGSAMQRLGADSAYFILACAHVLAFVFLLQLRSVGQAAAAPLENPAPLRQIFREYAAELYNNRILLALIIVTAAVEILGFSFATILPELANNRLGIGPEGLGTMHAARAVGGIAAGLVWASVGSNLQRPHLIYLGIIYTLGIGLFALAYASDFTFTIMALLIVALATASTDVLSQSMMQLCVSNELRGRAMGAWELAIGTAPLGHLEMGVLASSLGLATALSINAAGLLLIAILMTLAITGAIPGFRRP